MAKRLSFTYTTENSNIPQTLVLATGKEAEYIMSHILGFNSSESSRVIFEVFGKTLALIRIKMYANQCSGILGARGENIEHVKKGICLGWKDSLLQLHSSVSTIDILNAKLHWSKSS